MTERCEVPRENATTDEVRRILTTARTVAVVGLSDKPERASYQVAAYLKAHGYRVIPVNPNIVGVLCQKAYPSLRELPEVVDIVDIFRPPEAVPKIVEAAIARRARVIWMQEGIVHNAAAERARAAGLSVVMNKCLMKEHQKMIAHAETQKNERG